MTGVQTCALPICWAPLIAGGSCVPVDLATAAEMQCSTSGVATPWSSSAAVLQWSARRRLLVLRCSARRCDVELQCSARYSNGARRRSQCSTRGAATPVELAGCGAAMKLSPPPPDVVLPPASIEAAALAAPMDLAGRRSRSCRARRCSNGALAGGSRCDVAALVGELEVAKQQLGAPMERSPAAHGAPMEPPQRLLELRCSD